jgi:death-on-curing family protein
MTAKAIATPFESLKFITTSHILRLHGRYVYPSATPTQPTLLDSAAYAPLNTLSYGPPSQHNPFYLAANLAEKIMQNHPYRDGNKRTALLTAGTFLRVNGYKMEPPQDGLEVEGKGVMKLENAIVGVVVKELTVEMLMTYFQRISRPVKD